MKRLFTYTAMLATIAVCVATVSSAQNRNIQDGFHLKQANLCFASPAPVDQFLSTETDQKLLFTAETVIHIIGDEPGEFPVPATLAVYLGPNSTNYTALAIFQDGVTCLLNEGTNFKPYSSQ